MKVIHIESGLGNQMLSYCEYIVLKKLNPNDLCYIETIVYDIAECNDTICQWNGYELGRVFGIDAPNIKSLFSEKQWNNIISDVRSSEFWSKGWNWPVAITSALNKAGLNLENERGDFELGSHLLNPSILFLMQQRLKQSGLGTVVRRVYYGITKRKRLKMCDNRKNIWMKTDRSILTGQWLSFKLRGNDIELLKEDIDKAFCFPPLADARSVDFARFLDSCNAVFIHARRGDMLSSNGWCYKHGYFRRAVKYIKLHVPDPVFVFFTNPGSVEWCKDNARTFGLDYSQDKVYFVDWNAGADSFRDMQLMSHCKHGIITNSTFGWWGAYFITNPNKITISPEIYINTTHHC